MLRPQTPQSYVALILTHMLELSIAMPAGLATPVLKAQYGQTLQALSVLLGITAMVRVQLQVSRSAQQIPIIPIFEVQPHLTVSTVLRVKTAQQQVLPFLLTALQGITVLEDH